jgi:hypothetical protein
MPVTPDAIGAAIVGRHVARCCALHKRIYLPAITQYGLLLVDGPGSSFPD